MADARLRALERAAATGSVEDRAAHLRARARAGELGMVLPCEHAGSSYGGQRIGERSWETPHPCATSGRVWLPQGRLELAAYAGDEAARVAVGTCSCGCGWPLGTETSAGRLGPDLDHSDTRGFLTWARGVGRWGREVQARGELAAGEVAYTAWLASHGLVERDGRIREVDPGDWCSRAALNPSAPDPRAPRRALDACAAWLECQCEEHLAAWRRHASVGAPNWTPTPADQDQVPTSVELAARLAGEAAVRAAMQAGLRAWALEGELP